MFRRLEADINLLRQLQDGSTLNASVIGDLYQKLADSGAHTFDNVVRYDSGILQIGAPDSSSLLIDPENADPDSFSNLDYS